MPLREIKGRLFLHDAIYRDTSVGTDGSTCGTSDAFVSVLVCYEMIPPVIDFFGLELEHIARTSDNAKVTSFASLSVDVNSSYDFCHIVIRLNEK